MGIVVRFALRHLWRHRRLNLVVLAVMTLATLLLAGLPIYATVIAARSLRASLAGASPMERNLSLLASSSYRPNAALLGDMLDSIDDIVLGQIEVRDAHLATPALYGIEGGVMVEDLHLWTFSRLTERLRLIEGEFPDHWVPKTNQEKIKPPKAEAVIGVNAARQTGIQVGDLVVSSGGNIFFIVGVVEPTNPRDEAWFGDLSMFDIGIRAKDVNTDVAILPLIIPMASMKDYFTFHAATTRILLDHRKITVNNVDEVQAVLDQLNIYVSRAKLSLATGLDEMLARYQRQRATARVTLFLLTAQAMAFALYTLGLMARFLQERSTLELGTLTGRGAGRGQITAVFALQALLLGLVAASFGPPIVYNVARWALPDADVVLAHGIPFDSWQLAWVAIVFAWLAVVLSVFAATRHAQMEGQREATRPARLTGWQRAYADFFLMAVGALIYWQVTQSGGFLTQRLGAAGVADPVLLLGPTLLLVAVAMLSLRVIPTLLRGVAWLAQRVRGLLLPMGVARLARAPQSPSHVVLLISLAAGLTLFAHAFSTSLDARQAEMARYRAGADARVALDDVTLDEVRDFPGILGLSPVMRTTLRSYARGAINVIVVDSATFGDVAWYPSDFTTLTIAGLMPVLRDVTEPGVIPAIFHYEMLAANQHVGDYLTFSMSGVDLTLEVRGIIVNFPTAEAPFVVVDRDVLASIAGADYMRYVSTEEAWLALDPAQVSAIRRDFVLAPRLIADVETQLQALQADALTQSAEGAFRLNAAALALLSVIGFFMVHYISAQKRAYEFGILRAGGLSPGQLFALLSGEGALVMGLGLSTGTIIGYGLARVMMPTLSQVLAAALDGATITRILFDWRGVVPLYGLLVGGYALAMVFVLGMLAHAGIHRALRIGDE